MAGLVDPFQNALDEFNPKLGTTAVPHQIQNPETQERTEATPAPTLPAPTQAPQTPQAQPQALADPFEQVYQNVNGAPSSQAQLPAEAQAPENSNDESEGS